MKYRIKNRKLLKFSRKCGERVSASTVPTTVMKPMLIQRAVKVGRIRLIVSTVVSVVRPPLYMFIAVTATRPGSEHSMMIVPNPEKIWLATSWTWATGAASVAAEMMNAPTRDGMAPSAEPQSVHQNTVDGL